MGLFSTIAAADADHPETDCAKIKNYAAAGDKAYKAAQYEKARDSYTEQVGWSETCELPDSLIATAYNNVALTWIRQGDYLKAKAWLLIDEKDAKSQYNLALIKNKIASLPQPATPVGEYWEYAGRGMWNSYVVSAAGKEYKVNFDGVWAGLAAMYYGPNIGSLEGKAAIVNGRGVLRQREGGNDEWGNCDVTLKFTPMALTTSVTGDCGFGHNVSAAGHYMRVN
ncbi:tetratricopeptide repeat protein [Erwinia sp. 198]|nr:tetratricopeptide repeat protein [Erwinia sp. 198]